MRAHSSPQVVRNPGNGELVVGQTEVYQDFGIGLSISADDGRSWFDGGDPMMEPFTWVSDYAINGPYFTMAFEKDAGLYVAFTATDPRFADRNRSERPRSVFLAHSTDGGRSFTTSFVYQVPEGDPAVVNNRRAMVAIDPDDASDVYVSWMQSTTGQKAKSLLAASSDGGRRFGEPSTSRSPWRWGDTSRARRWDRTAWCTPSSPEPASPLKGLPGHPSRRIPSVLSSTAARPTRGRPGLP